MAVTQQAVDFEVRLLNQKGGLKGDRRDAAAMQRQNNNEMQQRMPKLERDDFALFQPRPQNVLRSILDALHQAAVGRHAAWKNDGRLVRAQVRLKADQFKPAHPYTYTRTAGLQRQSLRILTLGKIHHLKF